METSFIKLDNCKGMTKSCFLLSHLQGEGKEGIDLTLTDGEKYWEGRLTEEDLDALCSNLKMDFNTYVCETVKAFTQRNLGDLNFDYQLKSPAGAVVDFVWKKEVADKEIKIVMGSVTLHLQKATSALPCLFDRCIQMASFMQQRIHTLEVENQRLAQERQNALKFAAVLNSKKEKIRQLKNRGAAEFAPVPSTSDTSNEISNGRKSKARNARNSPSPAGVGSDKEEHDREDDEHDRDTDEDSPPRKRSAAVVSTAGEEDMDSSLALSDDDEFDKDKSLVRRPARQRGGNKRQTPQVKPVLPKVASAKSSDPGPLSAKKSSRGSMRKSGFGNSQRLSENLNTDDLLKDF